MEKYSSKIIKAGALIDDTKTMLANWDITQAVSLNLFRLRSANILGKATRSRIQDILAILHQRYLNEPEVINGLLPLIDHPKLSEAINQIFYFFSVKNDKLLHDAVTIFIANRKKREIEEITIEMMVDWIQNQVKDNKTTTTWSVETILRSSRGLLSTLRDFGVLQGVDKKRIAPFNLSLEAFVFIAFYKYQKIPSGERLISDPDQDKYPIRIDWDGILVDDPDHSSDIVARSHEVLEELFAERAEAIEQEACQILGVRGLREYFREPSSGGFWLDHIKRYSKIRRKAPIYWLLQSSRKNYALWFYYQRLDKDLLFKSLTQYVEPNIRQEEAHLQTQRREFGTGGKQAKELYKDIEREDDFIGEL